VGGIVYSSGAVSGVEANRRAAARQSCGPAAIVLTPGLQRPPFVSRLAPCDRRPAKLATVPTDAVSGLLVRFAPTGSSA